MAMRRPRHKLHRQLLDLLGLRTQHLGLPVHRLLRFSRLLLSSEIRGHWPQSSSWITFF